MTIKVFSRLAALSAAIAIVAGCASDAAGPVGPTARQIKPANDIGIASPGIAQVCIDPSSPAGIYRIALSNLQNIQPLDEVAASPMTINTSVPGPICANAIVRTQEIGGTVASVTMTASTARPGSFSYSCVDDAGGISCVTLTGTNGATAGENGYHGSTVTFKFVADAFTVPTPSFVIGDAEYHGVGDPAYFWGSDWWKDNRVTGDVDPGVGSFKGYATSADNFCGGSWVSRPGNAPPPSVLDNRIAVIVTSSIHKNGPEFTGDILEIVVVDPDNWYGPSPGHVGTGTVTRIVCPL